MKYKRMLCWVRPHEKKELTEAVNGQFPLVFAKNYEDFKSQIKKDDYLVISFKRVNKRIQQLVKEFNKNTFVFFEIKEKYIMTSSQFHISDEKNAIAGQYGAFEIVDNYLGIIPNLWKMRLNRNCKQPDCHPPRHVSEDELMEALKTNPTLRKLAQAFSEEFDKNGKYIGKY
jgi:hypothetical protein